MVEAAELNQKADNGTDTGKPLETLESKSSSNAGVAHTTTPEQNPGTSATPCCGTEVASHDYPLSAVKIGNEDQRGRLIIDVLWAVHDFKIFKTEKGISPQFSDNKTVAAEQRENYLKLGEELAHLNHLIQLLPHLRYVKRIFRGRTAKSNVPAKANPIVYYYERELARAIAQALEGNAEVGKATLAALNKRLEERQRNKGRVIYFLICLISALLIVVLPSWFLLDNTGINWSEVALAAVFGSVGALFSTAVGLRNLRIDADATLFMNWIYGGQRMLIGVVGAIVVYLAMRAGFVLELLPGGNNSTLGPNEIAFMSVLAGFSERLVPNLLDREPAGTSAKQ